MSSNRNLRELARTLPPMPKMDKGKPVTSIGYAYGSELLRANKDATDKYGEPVKPDVKYKVRIPVFVNHEKKLIDVWKKFGEAGVQQYVDLCYQMFDSKLKHEVRKEKEAFSRLPWYIRLWKKIKSLFEN